MTKKTIVFVSGGVISGLGKGLITVSIIESLRRLIPNIKIAPLKLDPYFNIDAGTMNPLQHGEVFVTTDGVEADLDLGHYERFTSLTMTKLNTLTTGQILQTLNQNERDGKYSGQTVQVVPHVENIILDRINNLLQHNDYLVIELGGTVGDLEGQYFYHAAQKICRDKTHFKTIHCHLSMIVKVPSSNEPKTKPMQNSVAIAAKDIHPPDILFCRNDIPIQPSLLQKIKDRTNVSYVISAHNSSNVYNIPNELARRGLLKALSELLDIPYQIDKLNLTPLTTFSNQFNITATNSIKIAIVGKYISELGEDLYKSIVESLYHVNSILKLGEGGIIYEIIDAERTPPEELLNFDGVIIAGGFGIRGVEDKIAVLKVTRENKIPTLGICLGLQCMAIEYARNVLNIPNAHSSEFSNSNQDEFVVDLLNSYKHGLEGGGLRKGDIPVSFQSPRLIKIYGTTEDTERHRHKYHIKSRFFKDSDFNITGMSREGYPEIMELSEENHPYYVGCQFHPEFKSRLGNPHPLILGLILATHK
jgi:CTP synthase